jgi:hypothetical protein
MNWFSSRHWTVATLTMVIKDYVDRLVALLPSFFAYLRKSTARVLQRAPSQEPQVHRAVVPLPGNACTCPVLNERLQLY